MDFQFLVSWYYLEHASLRWTTYIELLVIAYEWQVSYCGNFYMFMTDLRFAELRTLCLLGMNSRRQ